MICGLLLALQSFSQDDPLKRTVDAELLRHDMSILLDALQENHPGLHLYSSPTEIDQAFQIPDSVEEMELREAYALFAKAIDQVHDGHTNVLPGEMINAFVLRKQKFFPFTLKIIEGKVFVNHNFSEHDFLNRGTEILAINHVPIQDILNEIRVFVTCDGYDRDAKYE
ncbi:MAG: hypothetical protein HKN32_02840, partial [Flavobacteriales bacterium]|nr:hypothetical protein [Flavobacteriales bacterium]